MALTGPGAGGAAGPEAGGAARPEAGGAAGPGAGGAAGPGAGGRRVLLGLGSNLGDRWALLRLGVLALPDVVRASRVYETDPVGGPADQPAYLNACVELWSRAPARQILAAAQAAEAAAGRVRDVRWGPRTLDVDVLIIEGEEIDRPDLVVPHPRIWDRAFVLVPLAELAPDLIMAAGHPAGAGRPGWLAEGIRPAGTL